MADEDAELADLDQLVVNRLHYTYTVQDPQIFREDYRYIYSHVGKLTKLPLLWREREPQANMVVLDNDGKNLVYVPSTRIVELEESMLRRRWASFLRSIPATAQGPWVQKLGVLLKLTSFDPTETEVSAAEEVLAELKAKFPKNTAAEDVRELSAKMRDLYVPFVVAPDPDREGFVFVRHGVDVYEPIRIRPGRETRSGARTKYSTLGMLAFLAFGLIRFKVPVPLMAFRPLVWSRTDSLHLKVQLPAGLKIVGKPVEYPKGCFADTGILDLASVEEDAFYTYIARSDGEKLLERRENTRGEAERLLSQWRDANDRFAREPLLEPHDKRPRARKLLHATLKALAEIRNLSILGRTTVKALAGARRAYRPQILIKARMTRGMGPLLALLWVVVGAAYYSSLFGGYTIDRYIQLFAALIVVILTDAVFSIDKPFLRDGVVAHIAAATAVFVELPFLREATITIRSLLMLAGLSAHSL